MRFASLPRLAVPSVCLSLAIGGCDVQPTDPTGGAGFELVAAAASVNSESMERQVASVSFVNQVFTCGDGTTLTMTISGEVTTKIHQSVDGTGQTHSRLHINSQVDAVDDLGRTYSGAISQLNLIANASDGSYNQAQSIRLIGKGKAPNYRFHVVSHVATNANGDITADFSRSWLSCR